MNQDISHNKTEIKRQNSRESWRWKKNEKNKQTFVEASKLSFVYVLSLGGDHFRFLCLFLFHKITQISFELYEEN